MGALCVPQSEVKSHFTGHPGSGAGRSSESSRGRIDCLESDHVTIELPLPLAEVLAETEVAVERLAGGTVLTGGAYSERRGCSGFGA